jgi:hypothetical protein
MVNVKEPSDSSARRRGDVAYKATIKASLPPPSTMSTRHTLASASINYGCPTPARLAALAYREGQIQHKPPSLRRLASHRRQREAAPPREVSHRTRSERPLQDGAGHDQLESPKARGTHPVRL